MQIKVLQWNLWYKENINAIVQDIKRINPDIICAQELIQHKPRHIDTAKQLANLINCNYYYKAADTWSNRDDKETQGNAIFTSHEIVNSTFSFLQPPQHNPPNPWKEGRVYIDSEIAIGSDKIFVGTCHLSYTHKFKINNNRLQESNKLNQILETKKTKFIFAADLNALPDSKIVKDIEVYLNHAGPKFNQPTFANKVFDYRGFKVNNLRYRLDYIFTSKDIKVTNSHIIKTKSSDHLPILTTLEI